ncbi:MAG: glycosyltransferase family 2 protein [Candidatus Thiodiazotropha sp. (ex Monitilora ramsayi)]|nr:glycosyltransferase family 2 protein [Candidatus Thiodiazotropha sp. (ex Monitilora ramsayi)]
MQLSVVIPTYNRIGTLPRALDSVLAQTLPADEIIVVDDGSTDGTKEMMKTEYPQCRLLTQSNSGVSSARNLGIANANGDWIALLDSDDAWHPEKLAQQMSALNDSRGIRVCHTEEIWIRNGKRVNPMKKHAKCGGRIFQRCLPLCVISPSSVILHRTLFQEYGGFDTDLPACEDYDLWLRLCAQEEVRFLKEPLTIKYGGHDDQLSRKHWGMDRFRVTSLEKLLQSAPLSEQDRQATLETLVEKTGILAQGANKRGHQARAEHYLQLQKQYRERLISA